MLFRLGKPSSSPISSSAEWFKSTSPFVVQLIDGIGKPKAWQVKFTDSPGLTVIPVGRIENCGEDRIWTAKIQIERTSIG